MSFILEALKKSEKQQQKKNGKVVRTVYEPAPAKRFRPRSLGVIFLVLLVVNSLVLLWFFSPWKTSTPVERATKTALEVQPTSPSKTKTANLDMVPQTEEKNRSKTKVAASQTVKPLPVTRSEKKIYLLTQLPASIQQRLPTLKMSLHAFNREQPSASLIQLNDHILREGDRVTDSIMLEKITADGAILRYDGYRFLLSRRGYK